jgi:hypothetical protein
VALAQRVKRLEEKLRDVRRPSMANLSDDDEDCLDIVTICMPLTGGCCSPTYHDVEATAAWKRGWELHKKLYPITPVYLDPLSGKRTYAFSPFEKLNKREPIDGDVLRYSDLLADFESEVAVIDCMYNVLLAEVWQRKIPHLPYPLRWEGDTLFLRTRQRPSQDIAWKPAMEIDQEHPRFIWSLIERHDLGKTEHELARAQMPITPAVVFVVDAQGYRLTPHQIAYES